MEKESKNLYTGEDLKKSFDRGFESAVSLIEKSVSLSPNGSRYLIECMAKRTFLSRFLRKIVFNRSFNKR